MRNNKYLFLFILFSSTLYSKQCFIVENLKGHSLRESQNLKFEADNSKDKQFKIILDGKNSSVITTSKSKIKYFQINDYTILGIDTNKNNGVVIETYSFFPNKNKMTYTKTINGYSSRYNGSRVFVGNIKGKCY